MNGEEVEGQSKSHWDRIQTLSALNFNVGSYNTKCNSFNEALEAALALRAKRSELPYEIDGVVLKLDDEHLQNALGACTEKGEEHVFAGCKEQSAF